MKVRCEKMFSRGKEVVRLHYEVKPFSEVWSVEHREASGRVTVQSYRNKVEAYKAYRAMI